MKKYKAVLIGASAGGIQTLPIVLAGFGRKPHPPVVVVQHLHDSMNMSWVDFMAQRLQKEIIVPRDKEPVLAGRIYVAPPSYHLLIERGMTFALSIDERVHYCRPAADVLFESAVRSLKAPMVGVVLTGANQDGARGLALIKEAGGLAVVQDPKTAESPRMPEEAIAACEADHILPPEEIARLLGEIGTTKAAEAGAGKTGG